MRICNIDLLRWYADLNYLWSVLPMKSLKGPDPSVTVFSTKSSTNMSTNGVLCPPSLVVIWLRIKGG